MAGVPQKPVELLANRRGGRGRTLQVVVPGERRPVPRPPKDIDRYARAVWREFWTSPQAAAVRPSGMERLRRWIACVDQRHKLMDLLEATPLIKGSHGQLMLNPLARRVRDLTAEIERAEAAFGMTPQDEFRLRFEFAQAGVAGDKLRRLQERQANAPDDQEVIDLDALG